MFENACERHEQKTECCAFVRAVLRKSKRSSILDILELIELYAMCAKCAHSSIEIETTPRWCDGDKADACSGKTDT